MCVCDGEKLRFRYDRRNQRTFCFTEVMTDYDMVKQWYFDNSQFCVKISSVKEGSKKHLNIKT